MSTSVRADFPVRNVTFAIDETIPKYWHGGRRAVTIFFNNLSALFPEGERFFIKSVRRYKRDVDDPQLVAEIKAFSGQEGVHTREHEQYNALLKAQGYDIEALEREVARMLRFPERAGPLRDGLSLAITTALEHWTALLAHFVLENGSTLDGAHPVMAALWRWHAAEECEHKAVAFDVYERVGQGYPMRASAALLVGVMFWAIVGRQQWALMQQDGIATDPAEWADLARFLLLEQRVVQRLAPLWLLYFERDFHPWHIEDGHLITRWLKDYEEDPVYQKRVKKQPQVIPPIALDEVQR